MTTLFYHLLLPTGTMTEMTNSLFLLSFGEKKVLECIR